MSELSISQYVCQDAVQKSIESVLGNRKNQFITSVVSLVKTNKKLEECDKQSLFNACLTAASLDLPINQNLGFAYVIPYKDKVLGMVAQFQMGYKGFIQLAQRSGLVKTLNVTDVRDGEIKNNDRLTGEIEFSWLEDREKVKIIGYVAYFELLNGFKKTLYMNNDQLTKHAGRFSSKFRYDGKGLWADGG